MTGITRTELDSLTYDQQTDLYARIADGVPLRLALGAARMGVGRSRTYGETDAVRDERVAEEWAHATRAVVGPFRVKVYGPSPMTTGTLATWGDVEDCIAGLMPYVDRHDGRPYLFTGPCVEAHCGPFGWCVTSAEEVAEEAAA